MERLKKALLVAASSLLFCFPVYADEPEAADLPIEEVNHDIELINDSTKEASEISIDNLAEIQGGMIKSPSINPDADFEIFGYYVKKTNTGYSFGINLTGTPEEVSFNRTNNTNYTSNITLKSPNYQVNVAFDGLPYTINYIVGPNGNIPVNITITRDGYDSFSDINVSFEGTVSNIPTFLNNVGIIFSWLLATIGTLISFILANPFMAVSLLLFMAGAVISFYARIKNS